MSSDSKRLEQLGKAEKYVYQRAKSSFEKHAENCEHQYTGANGKRKCSHSQGKQSCSFPVCPLIRDREGKE